MASWLVTPVLMFMVVVAVVGGGWSPWLIGIAQWALRTMDAIALFAVDLPGAVVSLPELQAWEVAGLCVVASAILLAFNRRRLSMAILGTACLAATLLCLAVASSTSPGKLEVIFPYVGQGDAAIVRLPDGGVVVIDAGGAVWRGQRDPGLRVMGPILRRLMVRDIDLAILSHADPDHLNGFVYLSENFHIREFWHNGQGNGNPILRRVVAKIVADGGRVRVVGDLPAVMQRERVLFEVLHPRPEQGSDESYYPELSSNDNSIVLRLSFGESSILFSGDVESEAEAIFEHRIPKTDVLKVPHHGSRTSSTNGFIDQVQPSVAVISCGYKNQFGFPAREILDRYVSRDITVWRTDTMGMITLSTSGKEWDIHAFSSE